MLTKTQIQHLRKDEELTLRDVAQFTKYSFQYLSDLETGRFPLNFENYDEFINGINRAVAAKADGKLAKNKRGRKPKVKI